MKKRILFVLLVLIFSFLFIKPVNATSPIDYISDKNKFLERIAEIEDGEEATIYIDRIEYTGPLLINLDSKNIKIIGISSDSCFINSQFGCIMIDGTTEEDKVGTITFENVGFITGLDPINLDINNYSSSMDYGLKVDTGNVDLNIDNCKFEGFRYGKGSGGAIQVIYSNTNNTSCMANINVSNSIFDDNIAISGSAIYVSGKQNVNLTVSNCEFNNNVSAKGAIYVYSSNTIIKDCKFNSNYDYINNLTATEHFGSAIVSLNTNLILDNTSFTNNKGTSTIYIEKNKALISNCNISKNQSSNTCLQILNSSNKLVVIFNNVFDQNVNEKDIFFQCDRSDSNLEGEVRTKFFFNTFNNTGLDQVINNTHFNSFGNLFINPNVNSDSYPNNDNNYNATLTSMDKYNDSIKDKLVLDNEIIKENINLYENYYGTFYASHNIFTNEVIINNKKMNIEDVKHSDKFGRNFDNFYIDGIAFDSSRSLISSNGYVEVKAVYKLNSTGKFVFIILPIIIVVIIGSIIFMNKFLKKKTLKNQDNNTENKEDNEINKELLKDLSSREIEVLNLLLKGKERKDIANELFVSESTIKKHIASIYNKLGVKNRVGLFVKVKK